MSNNFLAFASGAVLLLSVSLCQHQTSRLAAAERPPDCRHGLEPGGGPMRCADPDNPNSYLYKKAHPPAKAVKPAPRVAPASKEYSIENPPKGDPKWCSAHAKSATELDRCWRRQHGEPMPEDIRPGRASQGAKSSPRGRTPTPAANGSCPGGMLRRGGWCY